MFGVRMQKNTLMTCSKCGHFWIKIPEGFQHKLYCSNCGGEVKEE